MNLEVKIDERVDVIALFKRQGDQLTLCMPHKMRYQNQETVFTELGLRHPTQQGKRMVHIFDMSDGVNDYRLEFDAEALTWTLVAVLEGGNHAVAD